MRVTAAYLLVLDLELRRRLLVSHLCVHHLLEKLIGTEEDVRVDCILDDEVVEALYVPRCGEHIVRHDVGIVDLEQVLLYDEVLAPQRDEVLLDCSAWWAVREEAADAAIDLKGLAEEEAALDEVVKVCLGTDKLGAVLGGSDGHDDSGTRMGRIATRPRFSLGAHSAA